MKPELYGWFADLILVVHFAIVAFNVGGFVVIWIGHFAGWKFVRNFTFRLIHLLALCYVALQAVIGMDCPLTVWESALRVKAGHSQYSGSFVEEWLGRIIFYDVDERILTIIYVAFFALVAVTFWRVPPRRKDLSRHLSEPKQRV